MGSGGGDWSDPANWSSGLVPGPNDNVIINEPNNPTIVFDATAGNATIHALTCSDTLSISGGSLTVTASSVISGSLSMTGGSLTATGSGVTVVANGPTSISGQACTRAMAQPCRCPTPTSYDKEKISTRTSWPTAPNAVDLPGLTGLSGEGNWLRVYAQAGGLVGLPNLASITNSYVNISADGMDAGGTLSTVDIPALTSFSDTNGWYGNLAATNGGDVIDPLLATTSSVNITVGASGASVPSEINTSQLTSISGGGISIYQPADLSGLTSLTNSGLYVTNGLAYSLPNLTTIDGSSLTATGRATLTLPNVTSYAKGWGGDVYFQAYGEEA